MKTCQLCGKQFKVKERIDGVIRNFSHRKYCLECSPFKKHNTAKLEEWGVVRTCIICSKGFESNKSKGDIGNVCGSCRTKIKRQDAKKEALAYLGGKCSNCGYDGNTAALHFHHKDPSLKEFEMGLSYRYSKEKVKEELDKCIILCANCHASLHHPEHCKA